MFLMHVVGFLAIDDSLLEAFFDILCQHPFLTEQATHLSGTSQLVGDMFSLHGQTHVESETNCSVQTLSSFALAR